LGDGCGRFRGPPPQAPHEQRDAEQQQARLDELRSEWADVFRRYREVTADVTSTSNRSDDRKQVEDLRSEMEQLNARIAAAQRKYFSPRYHMHGFVWVFIRKPAEGS
jgi:hypothetical protein